MKKIFLAIPILLVLILTACNTASGVTQTTSITSNPPTDTLPVQTRLIVGTFKLEGTDQAISADQAAELLPLWQVYQEMSTSHTSAQEEVDALVNQIQETMTSEQMNAIDDMDLVRQDVMTVMQEENIIETTPKQSTSQNSSNSFIPPQGGDMPGGGVPGGADIGIGGPQAQVTTSSQSTQTTQAQTTGDSSSALLDALIKLLQSKVA